MSEDFDRREDALHWLRDVDLFPKFFFDDPKTGKFFAVAGAAEKLVIDQPCAMPELEKQLREFARGRAVFGGVRFDPNRSADVIWRDYGAAFFFEPEQFVVGSQPFTPDAPAVHGGVVGATAIPVSPPQDWNDLFGRAQNTFRDTDITKLVLATTSKLDGLDVWSGLTRQFQSFTYLFQPNTDSTFCGTSPETLYRRNSQHVFCDALAGTRPVSPDAQETQTWRTELQTSEKDAHEHQVVVDFITSALEKIGNVTQGDRTVRTLPHLQHLWTPISATISSPDQLLSAIHPTPALCGYPRERSLGWLAEHEPFDRGWYGGAIGYLSDDEECFAVAIRSMLTTRESHHLFAGAGIVEASDPVAEWNEIQNKRQSIVNRFLRADR